jgi:guanylate kinase
MTGRLILISAPSGAGKTSLVAAALEHDANLVVSISHTTRPQRPAERADVNYHFSTAEEFQGMIEREEFLEHAEVFGNSYGTARAQVDALTAQGRDVILEIDWQGADQVRKLAPDTLSIFILPPSIDALAARLAARGQDSNESIARRLADARLEIAQAPRYQYIVVNDDFDTALADILAILRADRLASVRQTAHNDQVGAILHDRG